MTKVSVIIPNYNHACYLKQRIDTVLSQTYRNFELIILDDCSPDNSKEIIEQYRNHPKVKQIVYNQTNSGSTFKQWTAGIKLAKGDYIWIAESDDWCEPTLLETLMEGISRDPETGLAFCQSWYYYEPNKLKHPTYYPYYERIEEGAEFIKKNMLLGNKVVNASMAVWKKSLFEIIDKEFTTFKFSGDWLFWISIMQKSKVFISGRVLNYFRNHDKDVSSKFYMTGNNFIEDVKLYEILCQRNIVDRGTFKFLIRREYNIFQQVKHQIDETNLPHVYQAFGRHMSMNYYNKLLLSIRLSLFMIRERLFPAKTKTAVSY